MNLQPATAATAGGHAPSATAAPTFERRRLFITHVDAFGPYLKICGHLNPDAVDIVRSKLQQLLPTCSVIDASLQPSQQQSVLRIGTTCLYKRVNGAAPADFELVRARICNVIQGATVALANSFQVEVEFIDYGYNAVISSYELLFPQHPALIQNIPPLCTQYIALGICTDWKKTELDEIKRTIVHQTLDICIEMEFNEFKFISMKWKEFNFAEFLIHQKKIGAPVANTLLRDNFIKIFKQQKQQQKDQKTYNNNNASSINNNFNYLQQGNNNHTSTIPQQHTSSVIYPAMGVGMAGAMGVATFSGPNQYRDPMASRRSLAARLQQHQMPIVMLPTTPRMPHTIGVHVQNNQLPNFQKPVVTVEAKPVFNGANTVRTLQSSPHTARYQRPLAPQQLVTNTLQMQQSQSLEPTRPISKIATFKSNNLTVGKIYDVCVSYVENGPCLFLVQLVSAQSDLTVMMNQIEKVKLRQFTEKPVLGTACIARYSEDGQLYRALITSVQPTACKVAYVDYGNAELVKFDDLYEIPDEFLHHKAFAIRFTLSGHKDLEPIDESLKKAFKDLVIYKNCKLKVMPLEGPPFVQYCELYMQNDNIFEVLKQIQKCRLVYAKAEPLQNNDLVEIRYIDSPKHFYVQKVANIEEFEKLMDDMFLYYNVNQKVPNHLALGSPCIVKCENEWYRAEVMRADSTAIIVRHVDFGYEQKVTKNLLSTIAEKHLKLPRQAVQCCLKGFENNDLNKDLATTQFEMLAEESNRTRRSFTVKIFRIQPDGVNLVNLCTKELNVMRKLFKLSMPFEQYLILEKDDFNVYPQQNGNSNKLETNGGGGRKTPSSIASSNEISSVHSSKKGNILNSTTLRSDERQNQHQNTNKNMNQKQHSNYRINNENAAPSNANDWDKHSSASSSVDNRDSRSSSSEHKQMSKRGQKHRNHHQQQENKLNVSISSSSDRRSNGSGGGGGSGYNNKQQRGNNLPPRLQNIKPQQEQDNRQQKNSSSNVATSIQSQPQQQQQRSSSVQRSLNAPQGYSSQTQRHHKLSGSGGRSSKDGASGDDAFNSGNEKSPEEYMPFERAFPRQQIETPAREEVTICWWISPHQFYTHLKSRQAEFEQLMRRMQKFYQNKPNQNLQLKVGSYVIARYRKDNILYRARIIACNQMLRKYKVHFVDFGSQYTVGSEDIWQVEKRFSDFPCMAYLCAMSGIISNVDHLLIIDRMEKYLPTGSKLTCEYIERAESDGDLYYVNVNVNNMSLKETLKLDGLITDVCPELRLDLLPGQQIRAKISSVKDMLNFKIQIEGCDEHIKFLCSYDDVRYVKSNPDIALKFKQFYEGKSCVVNITDVTTNKVTLLRPLLPLLKEDIPTYICTYPIILESFDVRVIHIESGYRVYGHMLSNENEVAQLVDDMYNYYENGGYLLKTFEPDQICAAKSIDGNWYRARITTRPKTSKDLIEVFYIDYGNKEKIEETKLKELDEKFYVNKSAYAIEINLPIRIATEQSKNKNSKKSKDGSNSSADETTLLNELKTHAFSQEATVKAIEIRRNRLIADLQRHGQSIVQLLKEKQLIRGKDVDYVRKVIDKEKPNILEYIETVDLTLEDEDEIDKNPISSKAKVTGSPKKKKLPTKEALKPEVVNTENAKDSLKITDVKVIAPAKTEIVSQAVKVVPVVREPEIAVEVKSKPSTPVPTPTPIASTPEPEIDPYADMEHAVLSHCDNPTRFFIHLQHKLDELRNLQENLQIVASSLPPLMSVRNGAYCISHYSVDKQWYRAKIMDSELMVIQFIDYGNTDALTDTTDTKEMNVFPDIEPFCLPCALPIKPNGTADWVDAANAIFNDSYQKVLHFEYITRGDFVKKSFIRLLIDGVNVADKLIENGYAKPLELVQSGENCFISHVNGLTDFFIQYEKDSKALELIEIYLSENKKLSAINKFEKNKIVAALFPDDQMWYRAKLLRQIPSEGYEVLFIDYGNTSISPECREISQEIAQLPPLSKKCALELPEHCVAWSEQAEEKFSELSALGETIFTVELREPASDHAIVHLLIDGQNINEELELLCEQKALPSDTDVLNSSFCTTLHTSVYEDGARLDAIISHANSPSDFYVQFNKDAIRLEDMTTSLNSLGMDELMDPKVQQLCAAVFSEDGSLYRARILEIISQENKEYRVLFIDFGNEGIATDLRQLPQDLLQLKEFSKHCQLENANCFATPSLQSVAAETFNVLIDECQGLVKVELLEAMDAGSNESANDEPALVKLYTRITEENLCEKLQKLLAVASAANSASSGAAFDSAPTQKDKCFISYVVSPREFYVQLIKNSPKMEQIKSILGKESVEKELAVLKNAEVGRVCSAYSIEDECYYRGRVERVLAQNGGYEIFLLDHGNLLVATELRELPEELRSIPALAQKCTLNSIPQDASESSLQEHFNALAEAHFGEVFEMESDEFDAEKRLHTVKLQSNFKDLGEELANAVEIGSTLAGVLSPVPTLHNCSIIHVNSPMSFYLQLASDVAAVEEITDILLDAEADFEPFTALEVGAICAAQFPDDLAYYRARIVQVLDDAGKCEVHYLDFGNNAVTDQFRLLPRKLLQIEGYAKHCALEKAINNEKASAQFQALIDSRFSETFQVELLTTTGDPIFCRLFYQDKDVAQELHQLLTDGNEVVGNGAGADVWETINGEIKNDIVQNPSSELTNSSMEGPTTYCATEQ